MSAREPALRRVMLTLWRCMMGEWVTLPAAPETGERAAIRAANHGADVLLALPVDDRLALMRALAPDGWVVAREVGKRHEGRIGFDEAVGWNACRAAMLASGGDGV